MMPRPTPTRAVRIGRPAATSEPKVRMQHEQRDADADQLGRAADLDHAGSAGAVGLDGEAVAAGVVQHVHAARRSVAGSTSATESTSNSQVMVPTRPSSTERRQRARRWPRASPTGVPASSAACDERRRSCACGGLDRVGQRRVSGICGQRAEVRRGGASTAIGVLGVGQRAALGRGDDDLDARPGRRRPRRRGTARPAGRRPSPRGCPGSRRRRSSACDIVAAKAPTARTAMIQPARKSGQRRKAVLPRR